MNVKLLAASFAAAGALAACQSNGMANGNNMGNTMHNGMNQSGMHNHAHNQQQGNYMPVPQNMPDEKFKCRNDMTVTIKYLGNDRIGLSINTDASTSAVLSQARAASGELYTGERGLYNKATSWHQKAGEAYFSFRDPYNNLVETTCNKTR